MWRYAIAAATLLALIWIDYTRTRSTEAKLDELSVQLARLAARPAAPTIVLPAAAIAAPAQHAAAPADPPAQAATAQPRSDEPAEIEQRSPERVAALGEAHERLDAVLARGHLTSDDFLALHESLLVVNDPAESRAIGRSIASAINHRQLVAEDLQHIFP
jgi:hypothetical protein